MDDWKCVWEDPVQIDIWMATPTEGTPEHVEMMHAIGRHVDDIGQCVTISRVWFRYTGGTEAGIRIGVRNYPRFPSSQAELLGVAEKLGRVAAEAGRQKTFMIEGPEDVYWFTRNPGHLAEDHDWIV